MALTVVNLNVFPYTATNAAGTLYTQGGWTDPIWNGITVPSGFTTTPANLNNITATYNAVPASGSTGFLGVGIYNFVQQGVTQYIAGFLDGEQRSRIFYTDGSTIALPTMKFLQQFQYSDLGELGTNPSGGALKGGGFRMALVPATNNLIDATSPMTFILDPSAMLIFASTQFG